MKQLYKCMTKATDREGDGVRYSHNWVTARRGMFKVYEDGFSCGDWHFDYSEVDEAILYKTKQMFIPVNVLVVKAKERTYQFGFNPWANPFKHLKLDLRIEKIKLKYSTFSILIRLFALAILLYSMIGLKK